MKKTHLYILCLALCTLSLSLFCYKAFVLKFPITQDEKSTSWKVEAKIAFYANRKPAKLAVKLPNSDQNYLITDENFVSRGYGQTTENEGNNRTATWSIRQAEGGQTLYYRAAVQKREVENTPTSSSNKRKPIAMIEDLKYQGAELEAANSVATELKNKSADTDSLVRALIKSLNRRNLDENIQILLGKTTSNLEKLIAAKQILIVASIPAKIVQGVRLLEQGNAEIEPRLEVYDDSKEKWESYDPIDGDNDVPENYFKWWTGEEPIAAIKGADRLRVEVGVRQYEEEALVHALSVGRYANPLLLEFSLFSLPVQAQSVYKVILMVPLGAFIIIFLRSLVGIRSFGTFMPVLIALSFRETQLAWGLFLFTALIFGGLLVRFYLDHLKLLLVPRLGSILIVVVIMMLALSIITHKLGIGMGLSVALFPMVILTLTIERMCIVWDESGPFASIKQGFNTLLIAAIIFLITSNKTLEHLMFVFPELILIILAASLLLGRYTGYRLLELKRFKGLIKE